MSKVVVVDYGHGGTDPGATYKGLREKDLTLQIGKKISAKLRKNGVKVVETRTKDQTVSLNKRSQIANNANADLFVSIHINSFATEKANGVETFSHPNSKNGAKLAKDIQDELVNSGLFKTNRGTKTANFSVLRRTKMTATLVELGFIKNPHDVNVMKNKQDQLAQLVVAGILKHLGIKGTVKPPSKPVKPQTSKPKPAPSKPSPTKTISVMADEVDKGLHGNGHANRQKSLGVDSATYAKVRAEVNRRAGIKPSKPKKSISQMATEIIAGKHGSGHANRRSSLGISQSEYNKVRAEVNRRAGVKSKPTQSVNQMANKILTSKGVPNGHEARRKWLGVDNATYQKVRAEVNRRLK